ncbi:MAG: glycine zipper domain-containing protein [Candidatus Methylomirabilales bacterium]
MRKLTTLIAAVALLGACASQRPLSTREQGAVTGAVLGAGTGALIGGATGGNAGTGAAIGAGLGLLTGAVVGGAIENQRGETAYPPPGAVSPQPTVAPPPGQPRAATPPPSGATVDPTKGQFVNGTRWRVEVFVDAEPQGLQSASPIMLHPQEAQPYNLDLGPHRVIARAVVDTQFGTRAVGRYDRSIRVDPRGSGWTLRFTEADFR